ncbi:hypothetical protein VB779_14230 [Haloarculaceae archaeon H-GB11]|nr:hypothetical protein [Haloarculaceae archaeon H-GB11]
MSEDAPTKVAIACQGGGSHTAFTAGVLKELLREWDDGYELVGISGTSGERSTPSRRGTGSSPTAKSAQSNCSTRSGRISRPMTSPIG